LLRAPGSGAGPSGGRKRGLCEAFAAEVVTEVEALIGAGAAAGIDFEAIETATKREALRIAARAIERRLNEDLSDHAGPSLPCPCGGKACYAGRMEKTFETAVGAVTLRRAYYHCDDCGAGWFPRDIAYGMQRRSLSPAVLRMTGLVASRVSFAESEELLWELAGVRVEAKHVERAAEALGEEIAQDERQVVDEPEAQEALPPTLYLGMDGTGVPMRNEELEGRTGKDGTAKTREAKLCTVWSAEGRDQHGIPMRDPGSVSYSAAIESAATLDTDAVLSAFALRVEREARRRGFLRARRSVVLGDGAPWIWKLTAELFPGAIEILDRFHAKEHLSTVAKAIWGPASDLGRYWQTRRYEELDAGDVDAILAALQVHAETNDEARKCIGYIQTNRSRMRYPLFRAMGLCTSTGVVEAGCGVAIGSRLKRSGMHWTVCGANAIMALRTLILSRRFQDFWDRRARALAS
jgi:hypothetical protein